MEWWVSFLVIISSLFALMFIGLPVAFSFLAVNLIGVYIFFGGTAGMLQLIIQISGSLTTFTLVPVALFLLMGESCSILESGLISWIRWINGLAASAVGSHLWRLAGVYYFQHLPVTAWEALPYSDQRWYLKWKIVATKSQCPSARSWVAEGWQ